MGERKISPLYRLIKAAVRAVYPKIKVVGEENLPPEPVVYVGNHSQMNGPIACELYTPGEHYIWCAGEMMDKKKVPAYAYQDFWSEKPKAVRWFYKLLSYIIAPLSQLVFTNANTIGVYHDAKIITTFKKKRGDFSGASRAAKQHYLRVPGQVHRRGEALLQAHGKGAVLRAAVSGA